MIRYEESFSFPAVHTEVVFGYGSIEKSAGLGSMKHPIARRKRLMRMRKSTGFVMKPVIDVTTSEVIW